LDLATLQERRKQVRKTLAAAREELAILAQEELMMRGFCLDCEAELPEDAPPQQKYCKACAYKRRTRDVRVSPENCKICGRPLPPGKRCYCRPFCERAGNARRVLDYLARKKAMQNGSSQYASA
jgi:hypothetical protein